MDVGLGRTSSGKICERCQSLGARCFQHPLTTTSSIRSFSPKTSPKSPSLKRPKSPKTKSSPTKEIKILVVCGSADNLNDRDITDKITNKLIEKLLIPSDRLIDITLLNPGPYIRPVSELKSFALMGQEFIRPLIKGRENPWVEKNKYVMGSLGDEKTPNLLNEVFDAIYFIFCPVFIGYKSEKFTTQQFKNLIKKDGLIVVYPPRAPSSDHPMAHLPKIIKSISTLIAEYKVPHEKESYNNQEFSIYKKNA